LPDICGKIENPKEGSQSRDKKWISENLIDFESMVYGHKLMPYQQLCPSDLYALRCAVLYQRNLNINGQKAKQRVEGFKLIDHSENDIHCNIIDSQMQFDIKHFCLDMAQCVENWNQSNHQIGLTIYSGSEIFISFQQYKKRNAIRK
jgi:hypothetical protein